MAEATSGKIMLEIVTPERVVVSEEVDEVVLPGIEGEFGVLEGHIPFLTTLKVGELVYRTGGKAEHLAVSWGYVEVTGGSVKVLVEAAERATEIDVNRARMALEEAEKMLTAGKDDPDYERAKVRLEKAVIRVQVAGKK
ncbi:MAG: F0F1 ATP synthase subunit epsilon [bacterium]|nr:F0F1 ATP synthase subunit epsilon [bacterium]MDT8395141.1 F0F1 ATP synthase subunit epsilon [bacterium]